nr:polymorphic toxin type 47 domain-containing protein [Paenibacillus sambharensis]
MWVHNCKTALRYTLKPQDLDWRGTGKTWRDAVDLAFKKTGVNKEEFSASKWAKDENGKSFPVEWRSKNGAEVSIDYPHYGVDRNGNWASGPDAPHVGWQTPGKNNTVGHIILDEVPFGRPRNK